MYVCLIRKCVWVRKKGGVVCEAVLDVSEAQPPLCSSRQRFLASPWRQQQKEAGFATRPCLCGRPHASSRRLIGKHRSKALIEFPLVCHSSFVGAFLALGDKQVGCHSSAAVAAFAAAAAAADTHINYRAILKWLSAFEVSY